MKLRDILVFLDDGNASEGRLQLAINIARNHEASLSAVFLQTHRTLNSPRDHTAPWPGLALGLGVSGAIVTPPYDVLSEDVEQRFRNQLRSFSIKGDWYALDRPGTSELITLAQAVDLVIIGQTDPDARPAPMWRPEEIVIGCGRPVLMVPYVGIYPKVGHRVLVAWDGSREAVRALNDAVPLIRAADVVTVMTVRARPKDLGAKDGSMDRVLRHLSRHGITAHPMDAFQSGISISNILLSRSVDLAADLIVAGAYHHSQLRETLLGGVSRELFQHMTLPVLMSH